MTRVIIVNEQAPERDIISNLVASIETDIDVSTFGDPLEALSEIRAKPPDLLIADCTISSMDIREFLRRFRDEPKCQDVPAVIVAGHDSIRFRSIAFKAGTTEFLLAPIDHDVFRLQSRNLLSIHRARLEVSQPHRRDAERSDREITIEYEKSRLEQIEMFNGLIQTLSAKLVLKINELDRLRGDLQTVTDIAAMRAVFVDDQLRIRHFTDGVSTIYNLTPGDAGRSLGDIECALDYSELQCDFMCVMQTGQPVERYLERRDGIAHFLMRISPNRSKDAIIWGAAITFVKTNAWYRGHA